MESHGHSFFQQLMDPTLLLPRDQDWTGILPFGPLPEVSSPCALPADFIFLRFTQHSAAVAGNICLPGMLLFNALGKHEPSCWSLGPWANKQKRKMVPAVGWQGRERAGRQTWKVCHWLSIWGKHHPSHLPRLYYSPVAQLSTPTPTPQFISEQGRGLWLLAKCPFQGQGWSQLFTSVAFMLVLDALPKLLSLAFCILCWALETHWNRNGWWKGSGKSQW